MDLIKASSLRNKVWLTSSAFMPLCAAQSAACATATAPEVPEAGPEAGPQGPRAVQALGARPGLCFRLAAPCQSAQGPKQTLVSFSAAIRQSACRGSF